MCNETIDASTAPKQLVDAIATHATVFQNCVSQHGPPNDDQMRDYFTIDTIEPSFVSLMNAIESLAEECFRDAQFFRQLKSALGELGWDVEENSLRLDANGEPMVPTLKKLREFFAANTAAAQLILPLQAPATEASAGVPKKELQQYLLGLCSAFANWPGPIKVPSLLKDAETLAHKVVRRAATHIYLQPALPKTVDARACHRTSWAPRTLSFTSFTALGSGTYEAALREQLCAKGQTTATPLST